MIRPLILGGMVYGPTFLDIFERFCVASLRAPANLEALRGNGASLDLYTDRESVKRLSAIIGDLLPYELYELTPNPSDCLFETLAAAQFHTAMRAAAKDRAYHMLMPDQCYSARYFPNLFRLAEHGLDVIHNGFNVSMSAAHEIEIYRELFNDEHPLTVPAAILGEIAWSHLHERQYAYLMNRAKVPTAMPASHFHLWRARDRLMLFSPHNSPVYMTPETAMHYPFPSLGTLDGMIQWMVGDFVRPTIDDDMVFIGLEHAPAKEILPTVDWETFAQRCWSEIGGERNRLLYYRQPLTECPAAVVEGAPTVADVLERQGRIADGLEEWGIVGAAA